MALSVEWQSDLMVMFYVLLFVAGTIIVPKFLKEKGIISKFFARKIVHSFAGLACFAAPYLNYPILAVIMAAIMTIVTRKSSETTRIKPLRELFKAISEDEELKVNYLQGPFAYCMAITILVFIFIFFPDKYYFPISAILIMMYADTMASVIGRRYGKHNIPISWVGSKRSVEGSMAFFITALALSIFTFALLGQILPGNSKILTTNEIILLSFLISLISMLLELISPSKYDDLIVPLGATLLISLIALGIGVW
jgi:dolichol kinase